MRPKGEDVRGATVVADRGSVMPLLLGMATVLLLLVAGVIAIGSTFRARQELQHLCDAAAAAAGDAAAAAPQAPAAAAVRAAAAQAARWNPPRPVRTEVRLDGLVAHVRCTGSVDVTFGGVFQLTDLELEVDSVGRPSVWG